MSTRMNKTKLSKLLTRSVGILSLAAIPFLTSCLDDDDVNVNPEPVAYVSFYHGLPNLSSIQIEVDNNRYNTNPFEYSTYFDYGRFYTGNRNFSFKLGNAANSLLDTLVKFEADKAYSFFLSEEQENTFFPIIVEDEIESPASGKAMIRLVHLSPDAPDVSLQIGDEEEEIFENQAYREVSDFTEIDAGRVNFNLLSGENGDSLISADNINIREGRIYTLVVRGYIDNSSTAKSISLQLVRNYPNY